LLVRESSATMQRMKLRLHHVNVCSDDMEELHKFYSEALGLDVLPPLPMIELDEDVRSEPDERGDWQQNVGFFDASGADELQIHGSALVSELRDRGVETVLVFGVATNISVEGTARQLSDEGFRTIVIADCCTAADDATHDAGVGDRRPH
jgi:hypothetical protein